MTPQEIGHELRTAAHQLAANIDTLTGCTRDQRADLRGLADFLLRHADTLAPVASVFDPDGDAPQGRWMIREIPIAPGMSIRVPVRRAL